MGSPRRQRKKFSKPSHPWQKERILEEKDIRKSYGLRRKYEIWKMNTILKGFTKQAKNLITTTGPQSEKETSQLLTKLSSLGLIGTGAKLENVLGLTLKDVMERRLQTLVFKKHLARSMKQARQLIVHQHISIEGKKITAPSYLVLLSQEAVIQFAQSSSLSDEGHPERIQEQKAPKPKEAEKESKAPEKEKKEEPKHEAKEKKAEDKPKKPKKETKEKPKKEASK